MQKNPSANGSIQVAILKPFVDVYVPFLAKVINHTITENIFSEQLKMSEVVPFYKKEVKTRGVIATYIKHF